MNASSRTHSVWYSVAIYMPKAIVPDNEQTIEMIRQLDMHVPWEAGISFVKLDKYVRSATVSLPGERVDARVYYYEVTPGDDPMTIDRAYTYNDEHVNPLRDHIEGDACPFPDAIMAKVSFGLQLV